MLIFTLPPGIGDCSWVISKISHLFDKREMGVKISDGAPHRSSPYIDLLGVKNLGYDRWDFPRGALDINTDLDTLPDGEYTIECNSSLERGMKLADIFPKQPTNYHYPIFTTPEMRDRAFAFRHSLQGSPKIGIYASAYSGPCSWNINQWIEFCSMLRRQYPNAAFYCIGAEYDNRTRDLFIGLKNNGFSATEAIGNHHIGTTIEVLRGLDYFFAYPSGLGILADVIQTPCMMWIYPEFPQQLIGSYQDPDSKTPHINLPRTSPADSFKIFMERMANVE